MKNKLLLVLLVFVIFITACFEEDERYIPVPLDTVEIPYSMYEFQSYYSITDSKILTHNHFEDWDLGFESREDGYHIILNYARFMYAGNTYQTDFQKITSNIAEEMLFDPSSGNLDSAVLNDWVDLTNPDNPVFNQFVYIIDRGKSEGGDEYGLKKVVFEKMENDTFYIHFANLDNSEEYRAKIAKNKTTNFTLFSFEDGGKVLVSEPDKESWDLLFTKYSTIIPDDNGIPTDYLVRGVFLNPYKTIEVAQDTSKYFNNILFTHLNEYQYSSQQDAIGYNWKTFTDGVYTVEENQSYILRNVSGKYFKMRFIDFYNKEGEKGFPDFELIELQTYN